MPQQEFHRWRPALRSELQIVEDLHGEVALVSRGRDFVAAFPESWGRLLGLMDGQRDVAQLLAEQARFTGALDPRGLTATLARLSEAGAFSEPAPGIPRGEERPTVVDRLLGGLGRFLDGALTFQVSSPLRPGAAMRGVGGMLIIVAHLLGLTVLAYGPGWLFSDPSGALAMAVAAFAALSIAMSLRGMVRWVLLLHLGRSPRRVGLRFRLGLPFLDLDPRAASHLNRRSQVLLSLAGLLSLGLMAVVLMGTGSGGEIPVAGRAVLFALVLDLCPFARSDGSLLLEASFKIPWLRGRTLRFLRQGLLTRILRRSGGEREEGSLLTVLTLWAGWSGLALPLVIFPALTSSLDTTGHLLSEAMAADDALLSVLGLVTGLYLALVFCLVSVFGVFLLASFMLRSLRTFMPPRVGAAATADEAQLAVALEAMGLPPLSGAALERARWLRLGPGDEFLPRRGPSSGPVLVLDGEATVRRAEVSGLVHDVGLAGGGFLIPGSDDGVAWRWSLFTSNSTLLLALDANPEGPLGALADRIRRYETCPAIWGLGPDGVRWAASHSERSPSPGEILRSPHDGLVVLLRGSVLHTTDHGDVEIHGPRILPAAEGDTMKAGTNALLLELPFPGADLGFLPSWWRMG